MPRRWKLYLAIAPTAIILDQITKFWARAKLPTDASGNGLPVPVVENFWDWILAYNTGSAFSLFSDTTGSRVFLSLIALVAICFITWMVHKTEDEQIGMIVALSLMAGGAIGNVIDRIFLGKVTDFVLWRYYEHRWPVFNVADIFLSVAVPLFVIVSLKAAKKEKLAAAAAAAESSKSKSKGQSKNKSRARAKAKSRS